MRLGAVSFYAEKGDRAMSERKLSDEQRMKLFREMSEDKRRELCEKVRAHYASEKPKLKLVCDSDSPKQEHQPAPVLILDDKENQL